MINAIIILIGVLLAGIVIGALVTGHQDNRRLQRILDRLQDALIVRGGIAPHDVNMVNWATGGKAVIKSIRHELQDK
jgi:hypothetical protein